MYTNNIIARNEAATCIIIDKIRHYIKALNRNIRLLESLHCNAFTDAMDENLIIKYQVFGYEGNCPGEIENIQGQDYGYSQSHPCFPRTGHKMPRCHHCSQRYNQYQRPGKPDARCTSHQISVIDQETMSQVDVIIRHHNHNHNQNKHSTYP